MKCQVTGHKAQNVRVTGYLLWHDAHTGSADVGSTIQYFGSNGLHHPWRSTAWEIHPVTKIEVIRLALPRSLLARPRVRPSLWAHQTRRAIVRLITEHRIYESAPVNVIAMLVHNRSSLSREFKIVRDLMSLEPTSDIKFEIGHVLFIDIVGYSKLLISEQSAQIQQLREIVRGTEQLRAAEAAGKLMRLPAGDGGPAP